ELVDLVVGVSNRVDGGPAAIQPFLGEHVVGGIVGPGPLTAAVVSHAGQLIGIIVGIGGGAKRIGGGRQAVRGIVGIRGEVAFGIADEGLSAGQVIGIAGERTAGVCRANQLIDRIVDVRG